MAIYKLRRNPDVVLNIRRMPAADSDREQTTNRVGQVLGTGSATVRALINKGLLPGTQDESGRWRVREGDLARFIEERFERVKLADGAGEPKDDPKPAKDKQTNPKVAEPPVSGFVERCPGCHSLLAVPADVSAVRCATCGAVSDVD